MNAIVPRASIEQIVANRNATIELFTEAYDRIVDADAAIRAAGDMWKRVSPGVNNFNHGHEHEVQAFRNAVTMPPRELYLRTARKLVDIDVWAYIIERTDLERLMDREAKDKLRAQMAYVPDRVDRRGQLITDKEAAQGLPEVTVDNIMATLQGFMGEADMIFRRGIANVFSKLDRRFRSHDGFKIGSRVILTGVLSDFSGSLHYGATRDLLVDIERVFSVVDDKPDASFRAALGALEKDRENEKGLQASLNKLSNRRQSEVETEYFLIRCYMNGNAHLWMRRPDLVTKVNKLLAEYYGEVIGDGQAKEADPLDDVKNLPAKRFGFYPTPSPATDTVFGRVSLTRPINAPELRILEPSAGTGNLARRALAKTDGWDSDSRLHFPCRALVDCVEIQPHLAGGLEAEGVFNRVYCADFLRLTPQTTGLYDRIVMNPPFDRERDIDHVVHALEFLKPDGQLVAIMSAGTEFRETRKSVAFRALLDRLDAKWEDLPAGSFAETGTYVNTCVIRLWKDGRKQSNW